MLGAIARIAPPQPSEATARIAPRFLVPLRSPTVNNNLLLVPSYVVRVDAFGVDLRFETARSSSAFNFFGLDSKLFSQVQ